MSQKSFLTKKGFPALDYKANNIHNQVTDTNAHHKRTSHTPKTRYKNAGHRHTTSTTTTHPQDDRSTGKKCDGPRRTEGSKTMPPRRGTTTECRHRPIRRSSFHPELEGRRRSTTTKPTGRNTTSADAIIVGQSAYWASDVLRCFNSSVASPVRQPPAAMPPERP